MAGRGPSKPEVYLHAQFAELYARFSPDTRFVAYAASGVPEVYVQTLPNPAGGKWMVSKGGLARLGGVTAKNCSSWVPGPIA